MNPIVDKLLDADKAAQQILDAAHQYYEKTLEEIGNEKKKLREEYEARAAKHIADVKSTCDAEAAEAAEEIKSRYGALGAQLEKNFADGRDAWQDALFDRCVGGE